jgi:hypothetical protein
VIIDILRQNQPKPGKSNDAMLSDLPGESAAAGKIEDAHIEEILPTFHSRFVFITDN